MNHLFMIGLAIVFTTKTFAAIDKAEFKNAKANTVVMAVIDTGADLNHQELKDHLWTNPGESGLDKNGNDKATNGIDDDDNGFVDDIHGWNFSKNNNDLTDHVGHGTHVSGIIKKEFYRAQSTESHGLGRLQLMILKYYDPNGKSYDNLVNSTRAIEYANKMRAQLINYSGGGVDSSIQERLAIEQSLQQNIIFVAAAGNNFANTDFEKYYPASYPFANIISVAATNDTGQLVSFSNYGSQIDIAAPGKLIYSALPDNKYGFLSGTSQATAFVSGLAARIFADNKTSAQEILAEMKARGKFNESLRGKIKTQVALLNN